MYCGGVTVNLASASLSGIAEVEILYGREIEQNKHFHVKL